MPGLNNGGPRPAGDDGAADPRIAAVLAAYGAGRDSEQAALTALAGARLLLPLVERPADAAVTPEPVPPGPAAAEPAGACAAGSVHGGADGGAHDDGCDHRMAREMAFPTLIGRDGRPALLAFTSLAALVGWRPDARPVPTPAEQVWGQAVADACAVVIDVAGPVPLAVDGTRLAALAAGQPVPAPPDDPDIRADVAAALADLPGLAGAELTAGPDGTDLAVRLLIHPVAPGAGRPATVQATIQQAAGAIAARLAGRLRRGIEFSAAMAPAATPPRPATPAASKTHATPAPRPSRPRG